MPVNDFEKQVQRKMDELQLRPSGEVWTEVEKRIRKEKQRRRILLWFFLAGILLLGGGGTAWWILDRTHPTTQQELAQADTKNQTAQPGNTVDPVAGKQPGTNDQSPVNNNDVAPQPSINSSSTTTNPNTTGNDPVTSTGVKNNNNRNIQPPVVTHPSSPEDQLDISTQQAAIERRRNTNNQTTKPASGKPNTTVPVSSEKTSVPSKAVDENVQKPVINKTVVPDKTTISPTGIKPVAADQPKKDSVVADSFVVKTNEPVAPAKEAIRITRKQKNKWEFGITGGMGVSTIVSGFPFFGSNSMEKNLFNGGNPNVTPNGIQGAYPAYQFAPSDPEEGAYWQVGVYAKRKVSKKLAVSAGVQMASFSTTQTLGKYVTIPTSVVNSAYSADIMNYYRTGDGTVYRNHYYYLQVPVALHWQFNKGKKLPLIVHTGITAGRLTSSDALVYTPNSNLFYRDNRLLEKMQFSAQSGVSAKLMQDKKHPVTIGVQFNYHLSRLQKVQTEGSNNMSSFGVHAGWIIKK
jgi:hypothetical protein